MLGSISHKSLYVVYATVCYLINLLQYILCVIGCKHDGQ